MSTPSPYKNTNKTDRFGTVMKKVEDDGRHPSQDNTGRYPTDAHLRSFGFKIHSRPKHGPAVWEREGRLYNQSDAILKCSQLTKDLENRY